MKQDFAEADKDSRPKIGAFVLREHYWMGLELVPRLLKKLGVEPIDVKEAPEYTEEDLQDLIEGGEE